MKIKNLIKNSLFAKSFNLAKSNPGKIGLMVLFDASFLASFYYILPLLLGYTASAVLWPQSGAPDTQPDCPYCPANHGE